MNCFAPFQIYSWRYNYHQNFGTSGWLEDWNCSANLQIRKKNRRIALDPSSLGLWSARVHPEIPEITNKIQKNWGENTFHCERSVLSAPLGCLIELHKIAINRRLHFFIAYWQTLYHLPSQRFRVTIPAWAWMLVCVVVMETGAKTEGESLRWKRITPIPAVVSVHLGPQWAIET